jgi:uncharacterized membrane protein YbhN (UPF0104 family)
MKTSTRISALLKGLASAGLIWFLLQKIDLHAILATIASCKWRHLVPASCLFALSKLISSHRLNLFFNRSGIDLPPTVNLRLYLLGMFYNLFLPGGIGGDGYKVYFIRKNYAAGPRTIVSALLQDRISGLFALCQLLLALSLALEMFTPFRLYTISIMVVSLLAYYAVQRRFFPALAAPFIRTTVLAAAVQAAQLASVVFILLALNQTTDMFAYLFVFLLSSIIAVIPFTIGGIGARELTFLVGSQWLHLDTETSIAVSLLFFSITAGISFCGIIYSIRGLDPNAGGAPPPPPDNLRDDY